MISPARIWRTIDGELVPNEHPDAAFLVVGSGCEVPPADEEAVKEFLDANPDAIPAPELDEAEPEVDEASVDEPDLDEAEPEVDEASVDGPDLDESPADEPEPAAPKKRAGRHASKPEE